jgi:hypothetical protein
MTRSLGVLIAALTLLAGLSAPAFAAKPHKKATTTHVAKPAKKHHKKAK